MQRAVTTMRALLLSVEQEINDHSLLCMTEARHPEVVIDPESITIRASVVHKGKRRAHVIWADGDTIEEAAEQLIDKLDIWAESLK